jgi:hypothetical protein
MVGITFSVMLVEEKIMFTNLLSFLAAVNMAGCIRDISIGGTTRTIINFMLFLH